MWVGSAIHIILSLPSVASHYSFFNLGLELSVKFDEASQTQDGNRFLEGVQPVHWEFLVIC